MKPKLYIVRISAPCRAVWMLCVHHQYQVDVIDVDTLDENQWSTVFRGKSPTRSVPMYEDTDEDIVLWECHTILRYLASKLTSPLYPANLKARSIVNEVMDFQCTHLQPTIVQGVFPLIWDMFAYKDQKVTREMVAEGQTRLAQCLSYIESTYVSNTSFLLSESVTLGDLTIATTLSMVYAVNFDMAKYPRVNEWLLRVRQLPMWWEVNQDFEKWINELPTQNEVIPLGRRSKSPTTAARRVKNVAPASLSIDHEQIVQRLSSLRRSLTNRKRGASTTTTTTTLAANDASANANGA